MIKGTCYINRDAAGVDDLYYYSTAGRWYRYDEERRTLVESSAPRSPRLAPDEAGRLEHEDEIAEEITHQERVRAAVARIERPIGALFHAPGHDRPHLRALN